MRRLLCALLCAGLMAGSFCNVNAAEQRAMLTIRVNTVAKQDVTVVIRDADVLVRRSDLEDAGLRSLDLPATVKGSDLVSLASLKPGLTFHVDDVALTLDVTVTPTHLDSTLVDFRSRDDLRLSKPERSAFLNYSLSDSNQTGAAFAGEIGTHIGAGSFSSTMSVAANRQYNSNITRWIFDSPNSDRRLTIGDVITSTGDLGGDVAIAGVGLQRFFGLNPDITKTALPQVIGNALTPSTADIYINGTLYRHEVLPPGQFNFQNLPISQGPNNTTIVVTDAFGRQQTYSNYFYGADSLLAKGLSDFNYSFGLLHAQFGEQVGHGAAAAARYSEGLTNNLTAGGRIEFSPSLVSGGPAFTFRLHHGVVASEFAVSRSGAQAGEAALLSYQYVDPRISGGLAIVMQSPQYANLALRSDQDRTLFNTQVSIGKQLTRGTSFSVSFYRQRDRDNGAQSVWQISQIALLGETAQLQVSESLTSGGGRRQFGIQTALNFIPRRGLAASVSTSESAGQTRSNVQIQHALDSQTPAFGYTLSAGGGGGSIAEYAAAEYRGQYGDYLANFGGGTGPASLSLHAAGGLAFIDGHVFATQSINDSYALVDASGLGNVRVLANNVVVGRTNKRGYLIVPQLGSYLNNDISIASSDMPLDYSIADQTQHIAPAYRSGQTVRFGISRVRPVTGKVAVRFHDRSVVPAYGTLQVDSAGTIVASDIGEGGEFYFDSLSTGLHHAKIEFQGGQCSFDFTVPTNDAHFIKLGTLVCENGVRS